MPMAVPEHFGTNEVGGKSQDYCRFCYQNGAFTANISMDEMIEWCAGFIDLWNTPDGQKPPKEEAVALMKKHFPQLKRWAKKKVTENEYHKAVNRVVEYIDRHLTDPIDLDTLSDVAHTSSFHFHRIFRSIMGENVGEYIQRLRLENAARHLRTSSMNVKDITERTGYQTDQSFSKAFKKHFGVSPTAYRRLKDGDTKVSTFAVDKCPPPVPEIRTINHIKYIYIRIIDVYGSPKSYNIAWGKLYTFALQNEIINEQTGYLGLSYDDPTITAPNRCRFYAGITTCKDIKPQGEFGFQTIEGGRYAVFTLKGSYSKLMDFYNRIYSQWLPVSNYRLRDSVPFEKYLNNPEKVSEQDLLTEVYIPIDV